MHPATTTQNEISPAAISSEPDPIIAARIASVSFALFVAGGVIGLLNMMLMPVPFGWGYEMVTLATNLANHGTYANPYSVLDTGLTAAYTPLYPLFLSLLMRVFRNPDLATLAATVANILINCYFPLRACRVFRGSSFAACDLALWRASYGCSRLSLCQIGTPASRWLD